MFDLGKLSSTNICGIGAAMWGSEPLMWGSEVSFANNGVRRSEMWGSWPPSPPTLGEVTHKLRQFSILKMRLKMKLKLTQFH